MELNKKYNKISSAIFVVFFIFLISACGGGGSSSGCTKVTFNKEELDFASLHLFYEDSIELKGVTRDKYADEESYIYFINGDLPKGIDYEYDGCVLVFKGMPEEQGAFVFDVEAYVEFVYNNDDDEEENETLFDIVTDTEVESCYETDVYTYRIEVNNDF